MESRQIIVDFFDDQFDEAASKSGSGGGAVVLRDVLDRGLDNSGQVQRDAVGGFGIPEIVEVCRIPDVRLAELVGEELREEDLVETSSDRGHRLTARRRGFGAGRGGLEEFDETAVARGQVKRWKFVER